MLDIISPHKTMTSPDSVAQHPKHGVLSSDGEGVYWEGGGVTE